MKVLGLVPNSQTIGHLLQNKNTSELPPLLDSLVHLLTPRHGPSRSLALILKTLQECENQAGVEWCLNRMQEENIPMTNELLKQVIKEHAQKRQFNKCTELLRKWFATCLWGCLCVNSSKSEIVGLMMPRYPRHPPNSRAPSPWWHARAKRHRILDVCASSSQSWRSRLSRSTAYPYIT